MKKFLLSLASASFVSQAAANNRMPRSRRPRHLPSRSRFPGIDLQYVDDSVRPQDDLYKHVNGKWLATTEIPADKGSYGPFDKLRDESQEQRRGIIEGCRNRSMPPIRTSRRLPTLSSFMDRRHRRTPASSRSTPSSQGSTG